MRYKITVRNGNKKVVTYKYGPNEYDKAMDTLDYLEDTYPEYTIEFKDADPFQRAA